MNADEIVKALHKYAKNAQENFEVDTMRDFDSAADLIESLQAQLDRETQSANRWILAANDYRKEKERIEETSKALESDIYNAEMNLEHITSQLDASQASERAAVEDLKLIVDAVREKHCDETCCFACKFDCDTSITDSGAHACECPGFERDDCFEWRGSQAGKGEAE